MAQAALALLPAALTTERNPSLRVEVRVIQIRCRGNAPSDAIGAVQAQFHAQTAWMLEVVCRDGDAVPAASTPATVARAGHQRLEVNAALAVARALFPPETGCYRIGADQQTGTLLLRFHFPGPAQTRYAEQFAVVAEQTGWQVNMHPVEHQGALEGAVRQVLPSQATLVGAPSLHHARREVVARYRGVLAPAELAAVGTAFVELTGWTLQLQAA